MTNGNAANVTTIEGGRAIGVDLRELWRYRELFYFLTWRDIKVRYKQTILGAGWAILCPFMSMVVFSIFFGRLGGLNQRTGGIPYPLFVYPGLLAWTFFSNALSQASQSVVGGASLVTKVYFPRIIIPASAVGAALMDFAVAGSILVVMSFWYRNYPGWGLLFLPALVFLTIFVALGAGMFLSALNVIYRDFRYVIPFILQLWMFCSPVIYPVDIVPERWRWVLALNPMTGLINGFRAAWLSKPLDVSSLVVSVVAAGAMFAAGAAFFRRTERRFADVI